MNICALFVLATNLAYVTSTCMVDKTTMVEPTVLSYLYDERALPAIELVRAPQPYIDYWRMFGAKPEGTWNPDKYIRIINGRTSVVHEPWQRPTIRVRHSHYEKYRNYLEKRRGYEAVAKWEAHRNRVMGERSAPVQRRVNRPTTRTRTNRTFRTNRRENKRRQYIRPNKRQRRNYR
jgi:hypothetical protein